jgi:hypothetical protein
MEFLKKLDHPLLFLFFLVLALTGLQAFMAWGFSELELPGAAALVRH